MLFLYIFGFFFFARFFLQFLQINSFLRFNEGFGQLQLDQEFSFGNDLFVLLLQLLVKQLVRAIFNLFLLLLRETTIEWPCTGIRVRYLLDKIILYLFFGTFRDLKLDKLSPLAHLRGLLPFVVQDLEQCWRSFLKIFAQHLLVRLNCVASPLNFHRNILKGLNLV